MIRALVAFVVAGCLPVLLGANNAQTAMYLGLSAPLFLDRLQKTMQEAPAHSAPARIGVDTAEARES